MDDFKNIAPELSNIKKENSFKVPDNYFEDLPSKIQERIILQKKQSGYIYFLIKKPAFIISFSLILITLIILPFTISHFKKQANQTQLAYQNIEVSDLEYFDINEDMLIDEISAENSKSYVSENDENTEAVINYIIENVDYSTILDEL
ncbi:MAG: hypothetical protein GXO79_10395 [Chlorobi bacterium]|nr:hypothetical protein [Chlorobiota bacterium]